MNLLQKLAERDEFTDAVVRWKRSGSSEDLRSVLKHLRPIVAQRANDYPQVGPEIASAEFTRAALKGLKRLDPDKASAKTWAVTSMRAANRHLLRRATPLRIPDSRLQAVGRMRRAQEAGGTTAQQAKRARLSTKDMLLLQREARPVFLASREEIPHGQRASRAGEVWSLLRHELTGHERRVYDALSKDPHVRTNDLAKAMKVSPSRVSYYKKRIRDKLDGYSR
jgi:DNA-directed RNA polymerase specialized sigma subunit